MDFKGLVNYLIVSILGPLLGLLLAAAVVFFMWNILNILRNSDNPDELAKLKNRALWGAIAIAVMVSMWGLVNFFVNTFKLNMTPIQAGQLNPYNQYNQY